MRIESSMVKKICAFYMLLPENVISSIIDEANIKHIKGNSVEEKLTYILNNSQPFESVGKAIRKSMDTWRYFINFSAEYLSSHDVASEEYVSFSSRLKECVNASTEALIKVKLKGILNSEEYDNINAEKNDISVSENLDSEKNDSEINGEDYKMSLQSNQIMKLCFYLGVITNEYSNYYIINPFAYIENDKLVPVDSDVKTIRIKTNRDYSQLNDDKAQKCFYCEINTDDIETDINNKDQIWESKLMLKPLNSQMLYEIVSPYDDSINDMDEFRGKPHPFDCDRPSTDYIYVEVGENIYGPFTWTESSDQKIIIEPKAQSIDETFIINMVSKKDISKYVFQYNVLHNKEYIKKFLFLKSPESKKVLCQYDFIDDKTLIDQVSIKTTNLDFTRKEKQTFQQKVKELNNSVFSVERKERMLKIISEAEKSDINVDNLIVAVFERKINEDGFWKTELANQFINRIFESVDTSNNENMKDKIFSLFEKRDAYKEKKAQQNEELSKIKGEIEIAKAELDKIQKEKDEFRIVEVSQELEKKNNDLSELTQKVENLKAQYRLGDDYLAWKYKFDAKKEAEEENYNKQIEDYNKKIVDLKKDQAKVQNDLQKTVDGLIASAENAITKAYEDVAFNDVFSNMIVNKANEFQNNQMSASVGTSLKSPSSDLASDFNTANELIDYVAHSIKRYDRNDIANMLLCISQGFLTVFAGKPGTGKTSFCERLSKVIGLDRNDPSESRFVEVAVEKGWTSKRDFIGYYNPITRSFDKVNKDVYSAIKLLDSEASNQINDYPFFILLDEANLSPMEHYWADFMKVCDSDNNQIINIGEANNCLISKTLRFLATINYDTTTEPLSPRLLDRAWIIDLDSDIDFDNLSDIDVEPIKSVVPYSALVNFFGADFKLTEEREKEISDDIKSRLNKIYDICSHFISISPRVRKAVLKYYYIAKENDIFDDPENTNIALDYAVAQKVLPLINVFDGYENNVRKDLEELEKVFSNKTWPKCNSIIQQILNKSYNGYYNYFNK